MLFDSHAHYYEGFDDLEALMGAMAEAGVSHILAVPSDLLSTEHSIGLSQKYAFVHAAAGIHPHESGRFAEDTEAAMDALRELSKAEKCVAIGEMGLDYALNLAPVAAQKKVFSAQLQLAREVDLPIIVHSREAMEDTISMLRGSGTRGVIHCYSGSAESAKILVEMGYYISFAGVLTFKNARRAVEAAQAVPRDRILIETDCPYLTPEPFRGKRNDSRFVKYTCQKLGEILGVSFEEAARLTSDNAKRCFGIL